MEIDSFYHSPVQIECIFFVPGLYVLFQKLKIIHVIMSVYKEVLECPNKRWLLSMNSGRSAWYHDTTSAITCNRTLPKKKCFFMSSHTLTFPYSAPFHVSLSELSIAPLLPASSVPVPFPADWTRQLVPPWSNASQHTLESCKENRPKAIYTTYSVDMKVYRNEN